MKSLNVIGLMSGTSLDGIDAALVKINPDLSCEFIDGISINYSTEMQNKIFELFKENISPKFLCEMNFLIGEYFAQAVLKLEEKTKTKANLIASHGLTFYHNPTVETFENFPLASTLQIGEGAIIAERTGITTICDFRPKDMAAKGQGAPLVAFADEIFFKDNKINRAILNLGGIANVTVVSNDCELFAFDTGPANILIDYAMRKLYNLPFDKNGLIAKSGEIDNVFLDDLLKNPYFNQKPPKTTGRELFSETYLNTLLEKYNTKKANNIISTLTFLTTKTIKDAFEKFIFPQTRIDEIILGGGGAFNKTIKSQLEKEFNHKIKIKTHEDFNIPNKYKEAIAFALLGYCTYYGIPNNKKTATGAVKNVILGKIIK